MDRQKTFETVVEHLLSMGMVPSKALLENGEPAPWCAYRGSGGRRCAVGVLIPDGLYDEGMEGEDARSLMARFGRLREHLGVDKDDVYFLIDLQMIHDDMEGHSVMWLKDRLRRAASDYGLDLPESLR